MPTAKTKFTKVHAMITTVGSILAIMIGWNTLGFETLAYTSEVVEVSEFSVDTRLIILNQKLSTAKSDLYFAEKDLETNPGSEVTKNRIRDLRTDITNLNAQIAAVKARRKNPS